MRRAVDRYVDSLLRRRRPKDFAPTQDDLAVARAAITLLAESPDAAGPRQQFVDDLHRRITEQSTAAQSTAAQQPAAAPLWTRWVPDRRRVLQATTLAAAAAAAGATADHLLTRDRTQTQTQTHAQTEISPTTGAWQTVAVGADLPEGGVQPFDLGPVTGFLRRTAGRVQAVSGICTHQGMPALPHATTRHPGLPLPRITLAGQPLTHPRTNQALPSLPRLPVREYQRHIQIFAPQPPVTA